MNEHSGVMDLLVGTLKSRKMEEWRSQSSGNAGIGNKK